MLLDMQRRSVCEGYIAGTQPEFYVSLKTLSTAPSFELIVSLTAQMRAFSSILSYSSALLAFCRPTCLAAPHQRRSAGPYDSAPVSTVFQLDHNQTWFENLVVQRNSSILATRIDVPELWSIDPATKNGTSSQGTGSLLYKFPNATSLLGIAEVEKDVFAIVSGNLSLPSTIPTPGSYKIWTIDLTGEKPHAKLLAPIPDGVFLDGLVKFSDDLLLTTDAAKGVIWRLNTTTGESSQVLSHPSMKPAGGQPILVGVNGLKVQKGYVYYTSTTQEVFARFPVDENATPTGPIEVITSGLTFDDFALADDGTAYLSTNPQNELLRISPEGKVRLIAGSQVTKTVAGSTAVAFANDEQSVLYVSMSGASVEPVLCKTVEPAKIVAVKLRGAS